MSHSARTQVIITPGIFSLDARDWLTPRVYSLSARAIGSHPGDIFCPYDEFCMVVAFAVSFCIVL
eukprot:9485424-Pyramimonas_sp.AAC.1